MNEKKQWICSQFGAREKYAIPRALHANKQLQHLYTDLWIQPNSFFEKFNKRAKGRYHTYLQDATVTHFNSQMLFFKLREKLAKKDMFADVYYDQLLAKEVLKKTSTADIFFGYSYASRKSIEAAKKMGLFTILGQINPGPLEADLVIGEYKAFHQGQYPPFVPTADYWKKWEEEVSFADILLVNSAWSKQLLVEYGIAAEKCVVVPLAYERKTIVFNRVFKQAFTKNNPLQLLYLGGVELRKGFHYVVEAMKVLQHLPVHLQVVGELKGPDVVLSNLPANISYHKKVAPHEVDLFYKQADLFLFPTLSDGFGLTQLEAQSYQLPIVSTPFCAPIVEHQVNGWVLQEVNSKRIQDAIIAVLDEPSLLQQWSLQSVQMEDYSLDQLALRLGSLGV